MVASAADHQVCLVTVLNTLTGTGLKRKFALFLGVQGTRTEIKKGRTLFISPSVLLYCALRLSFLNKETINFF